MNEHEIPNFEYWLRTRFKLPGNPIQSLTKVVSSENIRELSHFTFLNLKNVSYPPIGYVRSIIKLSNEKYVLSPEHNALFGFINRKYIISYPHPSPSSNPPPSSHVFAPSYIHPSGRPFTLFLLKPPLLRLSFPFLLLCRPTPTFLLSLSILLLPLLFPVTLIFPFQISFPLLSIKQPRPPSLLR